MYYDKLTSILYFQVCYSFRPISFHHSSALVPLCPLLWLLHNASSQQSLPSYRALQLGWIGALYFGRAQRRDAGSSSGSTHCFVYACIYLDVNQLRRSPCVAGGVLGLIWWRKWAPSRLEQRRLFSIMRLLLMWGRWHHVASPSRGSVGEKSTHTQLLFITQHSKEAGLLIILHLIGVQGM